jgi:hypothetical protein
MVEAGPSYRASKRPSHAIHQELPPTRIHLFA